MKRIIFFNISALFIFSLFFIEAASAANIYVDKTLPANCTTGNYSIANRNCSGTDGDAYTTVAAAVAAMSGGDDIFLRGGTYYENCIYISGNASGTVVNYSSIQSYSGEWAIIDGENNCNCVTRSVFAMWASPQLQYFKFERLEIRGGGLSGGGEVTAAAINLSDPKNIIIRYCYIHDNFSDSQNENPSGVSLNKPIDCTIEFCYFNDNGTNGSVGGNATNINFFSDYRDTTDSDFDVNDCTRGNIVRYNLLDSIKGYTGTGLRHKNQQIFGEQDRSPVNMTNKNYGDKFHHNIIKGVREIGVEAQQDFCQVYNNIIHHTGTDEIIPAGILIKKFGSDAEVFQTTVYNNTIIGTGSEIVGIHISGLSSSKDFHPYSQVYNNIVDNFADDYRREDISLGTTINIANDWVPLGTITLIDCPIDRNYIYRPADADEFAVARADYFGGDNRFTTAEYNTNYNKINYTSAYDASNLLFVGTSGPAQYKTQKTHILEGSTTIANGGIGGNHPYLSGVTIPSYIGAVNPNGVDSGLNWDPVAQDPDDAGWVDYVLYVVGNPRPTTLSIKEVIP